jgi:hypothetical protein
MCPVYPLAVQLRTVHPPGIDLSPAPPPVLSQTFRIVTAAAGPAAWLPSATEYQAAGYQAAGFRAAVTGSELTLSEQTPLPPASEESAPWP